MLIDLEKDSKYQEQIIEYKFVSELMVSLAFQGKKLELMRVHTDAFGYDLILKVDHVTKYVQLKSRKSAGAAQYRMYTNRCLRMRTEWYSWYCMISRTGTWN